MLKIQKLEQELELTKSQFKEQQEIADKAKIELLETSKGIETLKQTESLLREELNGIFTRFVSSKGAQS